jgi:hypothetical protein
MCPPHAVASSLPPSFHGGTKRNNVEPEVDRYDANDFD